MTWTSPSASYGVPTGSSGRVPPCAAGCSRSTPSPRLRRSSSRTAPTLHLRRSTVSSERGGRARATWSPRRTAASGVIRSCSTGLSGSRYPTRAHVRSSLCSSPVTTWAIRATSTYPRTCPSASVSRPSRAGGLRPAAPLAGSCPARGAAGPSFARRRASPGGAADQSERRTEGRQLLLQLGRHLFRAHLADEDPQALLEAVPLAAVTASVEMFLRLGALSVVELAVEVRLHPLFTLVAEIVVLHRHPPTVWSASAVFRIRRPRCKRDMTVPMGMSRIWAASW